MKRLNREGITVTRDGYRAIMDDLSAGLVESVRKNVLDGLQPRLTYDNLDFKILVNIILQSHRNTDMHWIAHFITFDRVPSEHLDDSKPQVTDINDFENIQYLLSKDELSKLHGDFVILVARVLAEFFEFLRTLKGSVITEHIPHRYNLLLCTFSVIVQ